MRKIESAADIAEGMAHLRACCPRWDAVADDLGDLPLRRRDDGFGAIREAIIGQQISVQAAASISEKLREAGLSTPDAIRDNDVETLRGAGLSRPKARYLKGIAEADLNWDGLRTQSDEDVIKSLVALPGIGRWTAEIYLAFALGRPDAFPAADLALQEAARVLYDLEDRPTDKALRQLAEPWRPWRAVAARGLWAYYRLVKNREGIR